MLSDRLKLLIETLGIKKGDFSEKIGFTQAYISMILNGSKKNPSDRFFESVKREFNVSLNWLKNGDGEMFVIENNNLSQFQKNLVSKYNQLPLSERKIIDEIIDAMIIKNQATKEPS